MAIELNPKDLDRLKRLMGRPMKPTRRQKADALLRLAEGKSVTEAAQLVGIPKDEITALVDAYAERGLAGIGLAESTRIQKTPGVCGGTARIAGTRVPVWQLVEARQLGATEAQLLLDFPRLRAADLVAAWKYAEDHPDEIGDAIHQNEAV